MCLICSVGVWNAPGSYCSCSFKCQSFISSFLSFRWSIKYLLQFMCFNIVCFFSRCVYSIFFLLKCSAFLGREPQLSGDVQLLLQCKLAFHICLDLFYFLAVCFNNTILLYRVPGWVERRLLDLRFYWVCWCNIPCFWVHFVIFRSILFFAFFLFVLTPWLLHISLL